MNSGWAQWMGLIIIPLVVAVGQILFKVTAVSNAGQGFLGLLGNATFWTAIILYGVATVVWIPMIESVPISRAYLFMALTYVYVPLFATVSARGGFPALCVGNGSDNCRYPDFRVALNCSRVVQTISRR